MESIVLVLASYEHAGHRRKMIADKNNIHNITKSQIKYVKNQSRRSERLHLLSCNVPMLRCVLRGTNMQDGKGEEGEVCHEGGR